MAALLVLSEIQSLSPTESLLERIALLILTIVSLSGLLWIMIKKPFQSSFEGRKGFGAIKVGIRVAVIFIGVSLIANFACPCFLADYVVIIIKQTSERVQKMYFSFILRHWTTLSTVI